MDKLLRFENNIQSGTNPVCYRVRFDKMFCINLTIPKDSSTLHKVMKANTKLLYTVVNCDVYDTLTGCSLSQP